MNARALDRTWFLRGITLRKSHACPVLSVPSGLSRLVLPPPLLLWLSVWFVHVEVRLHTTPP
eukprot:6564156-Prymnesium_polylepis.1